ncbi:hypothetical protein H0E87_031082 [Populus deltoides]|uniref:Uncharacterized protein n=1 Tax=Populus deltoides TaxID=3696 RepID=A0A8T2WI84_POPDE|nr:hypothetical protein H0E87_031082 [Populus deltoides]
MEGFPPSSMDDLTEFDLESLFLSPASEVPVNQGSISCNYQGGQNNAINDSIQQTTQFPPSFPETMTGHGYMTPNATTSQHGEFNQSGPSSPAPCEFNQPNPNLFDPLRDQQLTNYQLPMSNQVPAMLHGPQPPMNQWHQYSNIHQPQPGHGYMTPNATTSEHGGFIQPGPSFPAPRSQYFSNQGQVDQAAVIPNKDNVQQENFVPRSQMDNLQVQGLQNQTARPNASNPGLGTSVQSQNRGLNTQQGTKRSSGCRTRSGEERITPHAIAGNDVVSMTGMRATEDGVSEGALESRPRTEPVDRSLEQSSAVLGNLAGVLEG